MYTARIDISTIQRTRSPLPWPLFLRTHADDSTCGRQEGRELFFDPAPVSRVCVETCMLSGGHSSSSFSYQTSEKRRKRSTKRSSTRPQHNRPVSAACLLLFVHLRVFLFFGHSPEFFPFFPRRTPFNSTRNASPSTLCRSSSSDSKSATSIRPTRATHRTCMYTHTYIYIYIYVSVSTSSTSPCVYLSTRSLQVKESAVCHLRLHRIVHSIMDRWRERCRRTGETTESFCSCISSNIAERETRHCWALLGQTKAKKTLDRPFTTRILPAPCPWSSSRTPRTPYETNSKHNTPREDLARLLHARASPAHAAAGRPAVEEIPRLSVRASFILFHAERRGAKRRPLFASKEDLFLT